MISNSKLSRSLILAGLCLYPVLARGGEKQAAPAATVIPYFKEIQPEQLPAGLRPAYSQMLSGHLEKCVRQGESYGGKRGNVSAEFGFIVAALCKLEKNDLAGAEESLRDAVGRRGASPEAAYYKGIVYQRRGLPDKALASIGEAIWFGKSKLVPESELHLALGRILHAQYQAEAAGNAGKAPGSKAVIAKGDRLKSLGDKAQEELMKALNLKAADVGTRSEMATLYLERKNRAGAIQVLKAGVAAVAPADLNQLKLKIAEALLNRGDRGIPSADIIEARDIAKAVLETESGRDRYEGRAFTLYVRALIEGGELEEAQSNLREALKAIKATPELSHLSERLKIERSAANFKSSEKQEKESKGKTGGAGKEGDGPAAGHVPADQ